MVGEDWPRKNQELWTGENNRRKTEKHMKSYAYYIVLRIGNHTVVLFVKHTIYNNSLIYFQIYQKISATRDTITECRLDVYTLVNLYTI